MVCHKSLSLTKTLVHYRKECTYFYTAGKETVKLIIKVNTRNDIPSRTSSHCRLPNWMQPTIAYSYNEWVNILNEKPIEIS